MSEALDHLAKRVAADPFFLACPLAEFARSEQLDDAGLAAHLGCPVETLTPLRLCRVPRAESGDFRVDVGVVAARFGVAPAKLAAAVRLGDGLFRLRSAPRPATDAGKLLAARDGGPEPPSAAETPP